MDCSILYCRKLFGSLLEADQWFNRLMVLQSGPMLRTEGLAGAMTTEIAGRLSNARIRSAYCQSQGRRRISTPAEARPCWRAGIEAAASNPIMQDALWFGLDTGIRLGGVQSGSSAAAAARARISSFRVARRPDTASESLAEQA